MAFSFGNTGASTPAFGTPSTPFGFGAGTPATAAASTPAFSFGNAPAFGASSPSPFGASSTPAFGASSASLFGASSTPAFGFGSAPAFGASSTPGFSFNAAPTQAQTASAFGGGLFGGASTAVTPFGGGPNAQQAQQAATSLLTTDGRPLGHNTKWDDISPAAQNQLLELEKFIVRLREDCAVLDADERLSNPAAAKQRLPETSAALEQDIAALASRIKANESASDAVRDHVIHLLRSTESTLHAFQRSHAWREAAKLPPGQPLPPALVEQLGLGVVLPSPFLAASIESYADQVESLRRALGALQSVLPDEGEAAAAGAAFAGPEGIEAFHAMEEDTGTSPLSFTDFLEKMKDPAAANLVRTVKSFIKDFEERHSQGKATAEDDSARVQAFLTQSEELFRVHPVWRGSAPQVLDEAVEGLEKYLMSKVWRLTFATSPEDVERDERCARILDALSFVSLDTLMGSSGVEPDPALLKVAVGELLKMDKYKAPRDKLVCLVNVKTTAESLARPQRLASTIEYIKRFRGSSRLRGQFDYMLANLESVALYLDTVNYEHLHISREEFLARLSAAGLPEAALELEKRASLPCSPSGTAGPSGDELAGLLDVATSPLQAPKTTGDLESDSQSSEIGLLARGSWQQWERVHRLTTLPGEPPFIAELVADGVGAVLRAEAAGQLQPRYPFMYASAADLSLADVDSILAGYKQLVLQYEALSRSVVAQLTGSEEGGREQGADGFSEGTGWQGESAESHGWPEGVVRAESRDTPRAGTSPGVTEAVLSSPGRQAIDAGPHLLDLDHPPSGSPGAAQAERQESPAQRSTESANAGSINVAAIVARAVRVSDETESKDLLL
ncbi:Vacuolar protein sorting-associated protein 9A [Auxenochlorella protothecoides]|uniref:Vacuolar protein sorting-associated protein 9A n=1 Tax=Auxenochlorella protothecoides TaxID=3075 RepID=A0A087SCA9_AUXPR|nr:Vacuolar protein sorting-associated protein 9A [Auxenochlorella protothecoides]KFM23363.1 Vacuolar protein sorting-associated protein 9A [Auxenochlorella protothecoides]